MGHKGKLTLIETGEDCPLYDNATRVEMHYTMRSSYATPRYYWVSVFLPTSPYMSDRFCSSIGTCSRISLPQCSAQSQKVHETNSLHSEWVDLTQEVFPILLVYLFSFFVLVLDTAQLSKRFTPWIKC
jgi:hypothetical protein